MSNSNKKGLTDEEVLVQRKKYGDNSIETEKKIPIFFLFLRQFDDLLILILIIASIISLLTKDFESAFVILIVLAINATLGTIQTVNARSSIESLKKYQMQYAKVYRNGDLVKIPSQEVVKQDLIQFEAGDMIMADGIILEAFDCTINESALTGESISVHKEPSSNHVSKEAQMVYKGTLVQSGKGLARVENVGIHTEIGKNAKMIQESSKGKTPLQKNMDNLSRILACVILLVCLVIFLLEIKRGVPMLDSLLFGVALAVAAIPEALSSIVTITLSYGTKKMSKQKALCKSLDSVESLGNVSVICSDKTGIMTKNQMEVSSIFTSHRNRLNPKEDELFLMALALCNNALKEVGNETDKAINQFLEKNSYPYLMIKNKNPILEFTPFDSQTKMMMVKTENNCFIKGAPDYLIKDITSIWVNDKKEKLHQGTFFEIQDQIDDITSKGERAIMVGLKEEQETLFLGLIGLIDPPRDEMVESIKRCKQANVKCIMATGDYRGTAFEIGKKIGLTSSKEEIIDGAEMDTMDDYTLAQKIKETKIFARVTPSHKLRIVNALQANNEIVAMTGDGINDAPALRKANVGIAMGNGTDCAKESASIILSDDNFQTISEAIFLGRVIFGNIRNAILFLLSGNMAGLAIVLNSVIFDLPMPFNASKLLFINLVTDSFPAIALGLEEYHKKPLRRNQKMINFRFAFYALFYGLFLFTPVLFGFTYGLKESAIKACTISFSTLCLARLYHGYNCSNHPSFFRGAGKNKYCLYSLLVGMIMVNLILYFPTLSAFFGCTMLSKKEVLMVNLLAIIPTLAIQLIKEVRYLCLKK